MHTDIQSRAIVAKMMEHDAYSKWLGLQIEEVRLGYCRLRYTVKADMLNGFKRVHGGVLFSASDSAFAFACNTNGSVTVALDVSITFVRPAEEGDVLLVEAKELHLGNKTGLYDVKTFNEKGELLAVFKGTAYRTSKPVLQ